MTAALHNLHDHMAVPIGFLLLPLTATNSALLTLLPATELGVPGMEMIRLANPQCREYSKFEMSPKKKKEKKKMEPELRAF